jgi:hypothetical protein
MTQEVAKLEMYIVLLYFKHVYNIYKNVLHSV